MIILIPFIITLKLDSSNMYKGSFIVAKSFYKNSVNYSYLINNGIEIKFSMFGKALGMQKFDPLTIGTIQSVEVVSVLQQIGVNSIEVAVSQGDNFSVIGVVSGEYCKSIIDTLDDDRDCIFVGRLNTKTGGISYQQTFYVYKEGHDLAEFIGGIK